MGDRRMAEIKVKDGSLFVYTHNYGAEFPAMAEAALDSARCRLGDDCYALRIVIDQLTRPGRDQELDFGLMLTPNAEDEYNNDQPSIIIDLTKGTVVILK